MLAAVGVRQRCLEHKLYPTHTQQGCNGRIILHVAGTLTCALRLIRLGETGVAWAGSFTICEGLLFPTLCFDCPCRWEIGDLASCTAEWLTPNMECGCRKQRSATEAMLLTESSLETMSFLCLSVGKTAAFRACKGGCEFCTYELHPHAVRQ
jgi:hypothetical protein